MQRKILLAALSFTWGLTGCTDSSPNSKTSTGPSTEIPPTIISPDTELPPVTELEPEPEPEPEVDNDFWLDSNTKIGKTSIWYGADAKSGSAYVDCANCDIEKISFKWIVDINEDDIYDIEEDIVVDGDQFIIDTRTYGKDVLLVASHIGYDETIEKEYIAPSNLINDITQLRNFSENYVGIQIDGNLTSWGNDYDLEDINFSLLPYDPYFVDVVASSEAFAALSTQGDVISWGAPSSGGNLPTTGHTDIKEIVASSNAFATLAHNNQVVSWGDGDAGAGQSGDLLASQITASSYSFGAINIHDKITITGKDSTKFDISMDIAESDIQYLVATNKTYYGVKNDGTVLAIWHEGSGTTEENRNEAQSEIGNVFEHSASKVVQLIPTINPESTSAVAALKEDGSVYTWGDSLNGGDSSSVELALSKDVDSIIANDKAFVALKIDDDIVTEVIVWGNNDSIGDLSSLPSDEVINVYPTKPFTFQLSNGLHYRDGNIVFLFLDIAQEVEAEKS